jgi:hypothetical protein
MYAQLPALSILIRAAAELRRSSGITVTKSVLDRDCYTDNIINDS